MAITQNVHFQWQNPELRKTIYPFREKKLRDFLLIYEEIDLWKSQGKQTVDHSAADALKQEYNRLQQALIQARQAKIQADQAIVVLQQKHRVLLGSKDIRVLVQTKIDLERKLGEQKARVTSIERRKDWYAKNAPDHPYFDKFNREYLAAKQAYDQLSNEFNGILSRYNSSLAPYEQEAKLQEQTRTTAQAKIRTLTDELRKLPALDKGAAITPRAIVQWLMQKRERELEQLNHDQLLEKVLQRFDKEPLRFPKWLQYMVVHFSGMRYKSSHASWADPKDLLESLMLEELKVKYQQTPAAVLEKEATQLIPAIQKERIGIAAAPQAKALDGLAASLANPYTRQSALLKYHSSKITDEIKRLGNAEVLSRLKARKDQFPEWAWKEVVARTDLRLEVQTENWETLTPQQAQARWQAENGHWRLLMDAWERKDITAWRKQHEQTLSLIVSRAVCNEIAEHIQHLRGNKPAAGLTAKPDWYLSAQKRDAARSYFRRPGAIPDLKNGASILFLGWVDRQPNAWQIARPLPGIELSPPQTVTGEKKNKPAAVAATKSAQWLRWTHEATVVEVAEMAGGTYVLTFETGQIGLTSGPWVECSTNGIYLLVSSPKIRLPLLTWMRCLIARRSSKPLRGYPLILHLMRMWNRIFRA